MFSDDAYRNPVIVNDRSGEGLAEANFRIGDLKNQLAEMEIKIQALYSVMVAQGIDPEVFEAKIDEIMKERVDAPPAQKPLKSCPECGKAVKPSPSNPLVGRCMFCGAKVPYNPTFK